MTDTSRTADQSAMGFAGLASLVSAVPAWTPPQPRAPSQGGRVAAILFAFGITATVGLLQNLSPHRALTPTMMNVDPRYIPPQPFAPPRFTPPAATWPEQLPSPQPSISEVKPPPGTGLTLSASQILYCLAQKVRLDDMEAIVDLASTQVDRFNALVEDYNQRCISYHYRSNDMENAQRRVEALRPALRAEAATEVETWR